MNKVIFIKEIKPTVFFVNHNETGELMQKAEMLIENNGKAVDAALSIILNSRNIISNIGEIPVGLVKFDIYIPDICEKTLIEFKLDAENETIHKFTMLWEPKRHWNVHFVPVTHHDIGYTDPVDILLPKFDSFYDSILRFCEETEDWPDESKYRYTVEVSWSLLHYMENRPGEVVDKLLEYIKEGRIEVSAFFAHLIDSCCSHEEFIRNIYPSFRLKHKYGIPINTASSVDLYGLSWAVPAVLSGAGIKYFYCGIPNVFEYCGAVPYHGLMDESRMLRHGRPDAFMWEAPDGSSVLAYYQAGYGHLLGHEGGRLNEPESFDSLFELLPGVLEKMEQNGSPFDVVHYSDNPTDNSSPQLKVSMIAREWNKHFAYPKIIVSTNRMFFEELEKECSDLKTVRGEIPHTDYTLAASSAAKESGINRITHDTIHTAEKLAALYSLISGTEYPLEDISKIYEDIHIFDEHCHGMAIPYGKQHDWTWSSKTHYAYRASASSELLLNKTTCNLASLIDRKDDGIYITIFNSLSFSRTDVVRLTGVNPYESTLGLVDLDTGKEVAYQVVEINDPRMPVPYAPFRHVFNHNELVFIAHDVPSMGYKTYKLAEANNPGIFATNVEASGNVLENNFYKLTFESVTGTLASIFDKELGKELVDQNAPHKLNQLVVRWARTYETESPVKAEIVVNDHGPVFKSITAYTCCAGCPVVAQEIILYNDIKKIDISNRILKDATPLQEIYIAFPFNVENPRFRYEGTECVVETFKDQLPGSNTNYYAIQHWAEVSNNETRIVLSPVEAHNMEFGGIWPCYISPMHMVVLPPGYGQDFIKPEDIDKGYMYSMVMINNFGTNFYTSQVGDMIFRYSITSESTEKKSCPVHRYGWSAANPLVPVYTEGKNQGVLKNSSSFLSLTPENVLLLTIKKAEDNNGMIIRLLETEGKSCIAGVNLPFIQIKKVFKTNLAEENQEELDTTGAYSIDVPVPAYGIVTLRLIV